MSKKANAQYERITPAVATKLLESNTHNRTLSQSKVDAYAREMKKGLWDERNGETIKIADDGVILDGQHRLWAVVESGVTLEFLVVRDLPRSAFKTIDIGKLRSSGDIVGIAGITQPNQIAAAATVILGYRKKKITIDGNSIATRLLKSEIIDFSLENAESLQASLKAAFNHGVGKVTGPGPAIGMHFLFTRHSKVEGREELADAFFYQLGTGIFDNRASPEGHPIRLLRERLIHNKSALSRFSVGTILAMMVKTWNAYAAGRSLRSFRIAKGEAFPAVE